MNAFAVMLAREGVKLDPPRDPLAAITYLRDVAIQIEHRLNGVHERTDENDRDRNKACRQPRAKGHVG